MFDSSPRWLEQLPKTFRTHRVALHKAPPPGLARDLEKSEGALPKAPRPPAITYMRIINTPPPTPFNNQETATEGVTEDAPHIQYFWGALEQMDQALRANFINFVSARSRLPNSVDEFPMNFKIQGPKLGVS